MILLFVVFISRRFDLYEIGDVMFKSDPEGYWLFRDTLSNILTIYPVIFSIGFLFVCYYYNLKREK